jgi:hypothetical protein
MRVAAGIVNGYSNALTTIFLTDLVDGVGLGKLLSREARNIRSLCAMGRLQDEVGVCVNMRERIPPEGFCAKAIAAEPNTAGRMVRTSTDQVVFRMCRLCSFTVK